jgi:hypothetical protein
MHFIGTSKSFQQRNIDGILMFGVDESCFSTVQKRAEDVLGERGKLQIGAVSSGVIKVTTAFVRALQEYLCYRW